MSKFVIVSIILLFVIGALAWGFLALNPDAFESERVPLGFDDPTVRALAVLSPNGGEVLVSGRKQIVRWRAQNVGEVYVSLVNGGKEFGTMGPFKASDGQFEWTVPDMKGWKESGLDTKNFKMFIYSVSPELRDESDGTFSIAF